MNKLFLGLIALFLSSMSMLCAINLKVENGTNQTIRIFAGFRSLDTKYKFINPGESANFEFEDIRVDMSKPFSMRTGSDDIIYPVLMIFNDQYYIVYNRPNPYLREKPNGSLSFKKVGQRGEFGELIIEKALDNNNSAKISVLGDKAVGFEIK